MRTAILALVTLVAPPAMADALSTFLLANQIQQNQRQSGANSSASDRRELPAAPTPKPNQYAEELKGIENAAQSLVSSIQVIADQTGRTNTILGGLLSPESDESSSSGDSSDASQVVSEDTLLLAIKKTGERSAEGTNTEGVTNAIIKDIVGGASRTTQGLVMEASRQMEFSLQQQAEEFKARDAESDEGLVTNVQELSKAGGGGNSHNRNGNAFSFAFSRRRPASPSSDGGQGLRGLPLPR